MDLLRQLVYTLPASSTSCVAQLKFRSVVDRTYADYGDLPYDGQLQIIFHRTGGLSRIYYGRPLSVSGRPCYILPMFYLFIFYGRLILRPWLTEVRESFTRGGP